MSETNNTQPPVDPLAETEPGPPPDEARDPAHDLARVLLAFLVCTDRAPMPD